MLPTPLPPVNVGWDVESSQRVAGPVAGWNIVEHLGWVLTLLGINWQFYWVM